MTAAKDSARQRRHDENFQKDVLDGLERIRSVLHDISDSLRELSDSITDAATATERTARASKAADGFTGSKLLLSVAEVAEMTGLSRSAIYGLRYADDGLVATKVGRRLMFHRDDLAQWLEDQRQVSDGTTTKPWKRSYLGGGIGAGHPRSSESPKRVWCQGTHTEPMAASRYSGRGVCRTCRDDVMVNADGRLRKHYPRGW